MSRVAQRRTVFLATLTVMAGAIAGEFGTLRLAGPANSASGNVQWIPLASGLEIGQTFTTPWNDFQGLQIRVKGEDVASLALQVDVDRMAPSPIGVLDGIVRRAQQRFSHISGEQGVDVNFPPIANSGGQLFRVRISVSELPNGRLAIAATPVDTYPFGSLSVNGKDQSGDLVFAAVGPNSSLAELLRSVMRGRPWPFSSPVILWVLIGIFSVAVSWLVVVAGEMTGALNAGGVRRNDP